MTSLFKYVPYSVQQLVTAVDHGTLALPDIQRPFVWTATKVRDLLDSMYRGYPVGQLMFMQVGAEPGAKQIGVDHKHASIPHHLIVDGQQRLTSLYAVVTGKPVVREDFSQARIKISFNPFTEQFAVHSATTDKQIGWLADVTTLFEDLLDAVDTFTARFEEAGREVSKTEYRRLHQVFDRVKSIQNYQFSVVEIDASADAEEMSEIFVRINSEGVTLNQADFILTLMSVFWGQGRQQLEDFARDCKLPTLSSTSSPFNWHIQPQPSQLLRVAIALAFRRAVLKHAYTVLRGRDVNTGKADPKQRQKQFAMLMAAQDHVLDLTNWHEFLRCLERAGYRGSRLISSENAVIYTYAMWLVGRVDYKVPFDRLREVIARWFFMAHLTGRYTGSFETQFERDLAVVSSLSDGDEYCANLDKIVSDTLSSDYWTIRLPNDLSTSASKSPALLAYFAALNILDAEPLLSTGKIRDWLDPALTLKKGVERHHLFPKAHLNSLKINDSSRVNQIANMALVEWSDNIKISSQAPATYWPQQVGAKSVDAKLTTERLALQTYWHALPPNWEKLDYNTFLAARRPLIATVVRDAFAQLSNEGYQPIYKPAGTAVVPKPGMTYFGIKMKDLLEAGLLESGARLAGRVDDMDAEAVVQADGTIVFDATTYSTPSGAGEAARKRPTNGWTFWRADTADGPRSLADLRTTLLETAM